MGIKANFNTSKIEALINAKLARIEDAIIQNLKTLGESCVKIAREEGNYTDRTGNLRSSVGFIVLANGKVVSENFESAFIDENGKGITTGRSFAEDIAKNYQSDYVLIVVAGMKYAAAVESKSRDVLTSAEIYAKQKLPSMLKSLKTGISRMK